MSSVQQQLDPQLVSNARVEIRKRLSQEQQDVLDCGFHLNQLVTCIAIAGAGKTRTAASLIVESILDERIDRIVVMTCMRSAANTALVRIGEALKISGLADKGVSVHSSNVRTIHSLARAANRFAGRPYFICSNVDDFLERAVDEVLCPHRLSRLGVGSFTAFWNARDRLVHNANAAEVAAGIVESNPGCSTEFYGVKLFKATCPAFDPALEAAGFKEVRCSHLIASLREIRKEIMERWLPFSSTDEAKANLIKRANELMEAEKVVDHVGSIYSFASSQEPVCGTGALLLVDEAQDLTKSQQIIVLTALRAGACATLIGDPSQGITFFAGALSNPIACMQQEAEAGGFTVKKNKLTINYRSSVEIVRASEAVLPEADRVARGGVIATFTREPVKLVSSPDEHQEARKIGRSIYQCVQDGVPHGEIAVLSYRNLNWNDPICEVLRNLHVAFTIRGLGKDTASPAGRILPALQVGLGVEEFSTDLAEQTTILQSFVRALQGCTFTEEVRTYVIETAEKRRVTAVKAYLDHTQDILDLTERDHPSQWSGKRDLLGNKVLVRNARKVNVIKATITARSAIEQMNVWISAANKGQTGIGGVYSPVGLPLVKAGVHAGFAEPSCPPPASYVPVSPFSSVARAIAVSYLKINPLRINEYNELLMQLDNIQDEDYLESWVGAVGEQLAKLQEQEESKVVCLSTMHRFKGSERDHVFVLRMNSKFDYVNVSRSKLEAYSSLHESNCLGIEGCSCVAFNAKHRQLLDLSISERKRVAHVALSRARQSLTVSVPGEAGESATALRAVCASC